MPRKKQTVASQAAARGPLPELPAGVLDELVKGPMTPEQAQDLMLALNKAVIERIIGAEMNAHLGYPPGSTKPPSRATSATVPRARRCSPTAARCASTCRATATAASSRS